ncbi:DUF4142 domain-containing protein [Pontibacter qinzhouensis]|uniref:DUF4142 domain-containing protein n=1 Tax=Pontibacter qinzhouensis TaxID=2603253 RepID=A0A5C8KAJ5_9BACT|nr:DUF4142 domain-containing protein [Pontibacter qinzhouensis]TXK52099.1 DUF4142 domain-containing protein [Pontibacter qinzhouensis]
MRKYILIASAVFGTFAFAACDSGTTTEQQTTSTGEVNEAVAGDTEALTEEKKELIPFMARASLMQIEMGRLAAEKGQSDQVRQYGQQMAELYSSKKDELRDFASSYGVSVPETLHEDQQEEVKKLRETKPEDFDMAYWDEAIDAHKDAIDEFGSTLKSEDEALANPFSVWARNTEKEKRAQMEQAMRFRLDQKDILRKRSGL